MNLRKLDFCSGEELHIQEEAHERAIGHGARPMDNIVPEVR